jgi:Cd2+/Zn2+-exporting ATPase
MVVLLISCPCALVISTPVTIVSALASAAGKGVLIKGGAFLEEAARLKAIAFDKTGVLTEGDPKVERFIPLNGRTVEQILPRLAGLEMRSEHPLGRAIYRYSQEQHCEPLPVHAFEALQGLGAQAAIGAEVFWVGSNRFVSEKHLQTPELQRQLNQFGDSTHTAVLCGTEREVWAMIGLKDSVRAEASTALKALRAEGVQSLVLLTGDNSATATAVGAELKLNDVRAELFPEDKATVIEELRNVHGSVAMVGDGINDAPAMAAASIGIALGKRATDVALETANILLMSGDLNKLPFLLQHARRTSAIIRQNVAIALGLKLIFLLSAMTGTATLWMAVVADMGATLLVTFNGLRLLRAKEAKAAAAASN